MSPRRRSARPTLPGRSGCRASACARACSAGRHSARRRRAETRSSPPTTRRWRTCRKWRKAFRGRRGPRRATSGLPSQPASPAPAGSRSATPARARDTRSDRPGSTDGSTDSAATGCGPRTATSPASGPSGQHAGDRWRRARPAVRHRQDDSASGPARPGQTQIPLRAGFLRAGPVLFQAFPFQTRGTSCRSKEIQTAWLRCKIFHAAVQHVLV